MWDARAPHIHRIEWFRNERIPCDGPLTAQIEECKLTERMGQAGVEPDVEKEFVKEATTASAPQRREEAEHKVSVQVGQHDCTKIVQFFTEFFTDDTKSGRK